MGCNCTPADVDGCELCRDSDKPKLPPSPRMVAALMKVAEASYDLRDSGPDDSDWLEKCKACSDALDELTNVEAEENR